MSTPTTAVATLAAAHPEPRGQLSSEQVARLLGGIHPSRVLSLDGNSHVSQQDIRAHLIRVFGFGGYDMEVLACDLVFEDSAMRTPKKYGNAPQKPDYLGWDVCYRALVRLTIRNPQGELVATYEDGSTATAQAQRSRGDAHDLAYKSAISLSVKRAAIALGDQFGLSLYNKGQTDPLVRGTLVLGSGEAKGGEGFDPNAAAALSPQVSLGNDEVDRPMREEADTAPEPEPQAGREPAVDAETGEVRDGAYWSAKCEAAMDAPALRLVWEGALADGVLDQGLKSQVLERKATLESEPAAAEPAAPAAAEPAPAKSPRKTATAPQADEDAPAGDR